MRYILSALTLVLLVTAVTDPTPTTTHEITPPAPSAPARAWTSVNCDEHDLAYAVEPDTEAARREAQEWCTRSGKAIEDLSWPDGWEPTTIPRAGI